MFMSMARAPITECKGVTCHPPRKKNSYCKKLLNILVWKNAIYSLRFKIIFLFTYKMYIYFIIWQNKCEWFLVFELFILWLSPPWVLTDGRPWSTVDIFFISMHRYIIVCMKVIAVILIMLNTADFWE